MVVDDSVVIRGLIARWIEADPLSPDAALYILNATKAPGTRAALVQALDEFDHLRVRLSAVSPNPPAVFRPLRPTPTTRRA